MALWGPHPTLLLPLVLLATILALSSGQLCVELNKIFSKEHWENSKSPAPNPTSYCNVMMRKQGLCGKRINTFIHSPKANISSVCSVGGTPLPGSLRRSKAFIPITTCRYNPQTRFYTGTYLSQRIVIGCCNGRPSYYKEM